MTIKPLSYSWGKIALSEAVLIEGVPYVTKRAIGEWLDYADARDGINKLLERNPHIENYSTAVKLTAVDGKNRDTRVYHPMGFLLIVMESGQPKAIAMKEEIAAFVWHQWAQASRGANSPLTGAQLASLGAQLARLMKELPDQTDQCAFEVNTRLIDILCARLGMEPPNYATLGKNRFQTALSL